MAPTGSTAGPLEGVRVVDLSPDSVGAQVTKTMADYGAEVLWIERPGGSRLRQRPGFPFVGRGKHSVVADLRTPEGAEQVRRLADSADVLVETFRPGVAERLGLGYAELSARNPRLVYASITGFGREGPWANLKGYEGVVAALVGLYGTFSGLGCGRGPAFTTVPWCADAASGIATHGVLSALFERHASGRGQWVETNLAQALTIHEGASSSWYSYLITRLWPEAFTQVPNVSSSGSPFHHFVFRLLIAQTGDGRWLQFAQNRPHLFEAFMRALGLERLLTDPEWKGIPVLESDEQRNELLRLMLAGVRERTLEQWQELFESQRDVWAEVYRTGPEVLDHPQLVHDHAVIELVDPERGPVRQPGAQFRVIGSPAPIPSPAPRLDDGAEVTWTAGASHSGGPAADDTPRRAPLAGVTVIELAVQYAAPYGVTLLADLGARVIKLEQLEGDSIRRQKPQFPEVGAGKVLQGKHSVAVDLQTPEGRAILHRLVERADVLVNGFRAGAAARGGFDAGTLQRLNPDLLYVNGTGYGIDGPCAERAAFAPSFGAAGGIAAAHLGHSLSEDAGLDLAEVTRYSALLRSASASVYASADGIGAMGVANAVLLGLLARARGAGGQQIVSSMLLSTAHTLADEVVDFDGRPDALRPGVDMRGPTALYRIYDASDGWVFLAAPMPEEWATLADALARHADLHADARFATAGERARHDDALTEVLAGVFAGRPANDWQTELTAVDLACVAVWTGPPEEVLMSDEYGRASGYLLDVVHPIFDEHPRLAPVVRFSRSVTTGGAADLCGAATETVLAELGYQRAEIDDLRTRGIVG